MKRTRAVSGPHKPSKRRWGRKGPKSVQAKEGKVNKMCVKYRASCGGKKLQHTVFRGGEGEGSYKIRRNEGRTQRQGGLKC